MKTPELSPLTVSRLLGRIVVAVVSVAAIGAVSYIVLLPLVLSSTFGSAQSIATAALGAAVVSGLVLLRCLFILPRLRRLADAASKGESPDPFDRDAVYATPRIAAFRVALAGFGALVAGYLPLGDLVVQQRTIAANVGAACAALTAVVLYASVRFAMRPLLESLRDDGRWDWDLGEVPVPAGDRLASRVSLAIAIPAAAATLLATLIVSAHLANLADDERAAARETFNQALSVPLRPGERMAGLEVAASALRGAGVPVMPARDGRFEIPDLPSTPSPLPVWPVPIAIVVASIAGLVVGRRIGERASLDVESAARRMATVGVRDIRTVTMGMARPRSVPEIREMALALDTLAATLLRMSEDQQRALTARTEAAGVRSFVLASVSHDLRGPLNSVLGFAELLLSGVEGPLTEGQRESLEALGRGGRDLMRLVGDLLDHARLDAGRMTLERRRVAVDTVIEQGRALAIERAKSPLRPDEIPIEGEAGLQVVGDETQIAYSLGALTAFALLRPGRDGRVTLRIRRDEERCVVSIRGGGTTPSREALTRLFEPFDFAPTGARAPAGLNLAVSVARGVVRLHGGTITAEPNDDSGITIQLDLPLAS